MKSSKILFLLIVLALLPAFSKADLCYQETANVSTACGGQASGSYSINGTWTDGGAATIDGDYSSFDTAPTANNGNLYINYSTASVSNKTLLWQVKSDALPSSANLTVPSQCFNVFGGQVLLRVQRTNQFLFKCYNSSGEWQQLGNDNTGSQLYEESVFWNVFPTQIQVNVSAFDEIGLNSLSLNLTVFNSTTSITESNKASPFLDILDITGVLRFDVSGLNYFQRRFYSTQESNSNKTIVAYLLGTTYAFISSHVVNVLDQEGQPIENALISINKTIGGNSVLLTQGKTTGSGSYSFVLDCLGDYTVIVTATGYTAYNSGMTISCPQSTLTVIMGKTSDFVTQQQYFQNVSYSLQPLGNIYDLFTPIILTINSSTNDLRYYNLTLYDTGQLLITANGTNPSGGNIEFNFSKIGKGSILIAQITFKSQSMSTEYSFNVSKQISSVSNNSITQKLQVDNVRMSISGFSSQTIVIIGAIGVTGLAAGISGLTGGLAIVFFIIVGVFTSLGWFNLVFFAVMAFASVALAHNYSRGRT